MRSITQTSVVCILCLTISFSAAAQELRAVDLNKLEGAPRLERAQYVRAVLAANPSIESATQAFRAALARVRQAGAFDDPIVSVSLAPLSIAPSRANVGYEVGISQQLPWFGRRALERDAMNAEAAAAQADLETTRRELAMTALTLYDQYFVAARSLEINGQHIQLLKELQDAVAAQLEAGRGSTQDVLQAEAELTHLEHQALMLAADRDVVSAEMNELLHREPESALPAPVSELVVPSEVSTDSSKQLEQEAVTKRAEISAARLHARAQAIKADAASREYYPSITLMGSYNSMWDMPQHRFMLGIGFNVPLPTDKRAGAVDEARAAQAQYESEAARMSDAARTQVYVAVRKVAESQHVLRLFETRLLPVAREQIAAARDGFTSSRSPFLAVIEAERNLRGVELDHQAAQAESDRLRAELERALGRVPGLDATEHAP